MARVKCLENLTIGDTKWLLNHELDRYLKSGTPILPEAWDIQKDLESLDWFEHRVLTLKPNEDVLEWILDQATIQLLEMSDVSLVALGLKIHQLNPFGEGQNND